MKNSKTPSVYRLVKRTLLGKFWLISSRYGNGSHCIFNLQRIDPPLASDDRDPEEPVPEVVSVAMVTDGAEVVVGAFGALPSGGERVRIRVRYQDWQSDKITYPGILPDSEDGLLPARVAHRPVVFRPGRR